ncbi:MAG: DUF302 domain-containing protein [Cyanobacteria bacterium SZAS-4]|nr:DUF302 domain-containing protein [Cyanobacteria bacterium SZAS-4]
MHIQSSTVTVLHVTKSSPKPFDEVIAAFEEQLGAADIAAMLKSVEAGEPYTAIEKMEGSSGLMIFSSIDMSGVIPSVLKTKRKARQYLVGNPLIADKMIRHHIEVGLYVPLRVFIAETDDGTTFVFDKPTSFLGQWNNAEIDVVAKSLEERLDNLTDKALAL